MAVSGLGGGPGANSPGLIGAFVEKNPLSDQAITGRPSVTFPLRIIPSGSPTGLEILSDESAAHDFRVVSQDGFRYVLAQFAAALADPLLVLQGAVQTATLSPQALAFSNLTQSTELMTAVNQGEAINRFMLGWDPTANVASLGDITTPSNTPDWRLAAGTQFGIDTPTLSLQIGTKPLITPAESPAQVGLPTGATGTAAGIPRPDHRHLFTGRFTFSGTDAQAILPGGAFPDNFARIKINNNWTLRRIWAYTKNGPTGGTETYGVVTAAGALQGTAVILPAGPGVSQAESALQATNLTGGTLYYLAQTAAGALVTVASTNVEVGIEYTMNV